MSNNTEEWWSIEDRTGHDISLHQFGWSVTTVGGSRYDIPPRRGDNLTLAYRPGQVYRAKLPDARPITLVMFMVGFDPATGQNLTVDGDYQRTQWNDNWDKLRRLVYRNYGVDNRVRLTRRWRLTAPEFSTTRVEGNVVAGDPGTSPAGQDRLVSAFALAEMTGNMAPTMTGRFRSDFQMDFILPDPYFYGETVTTTLECGDTRYVWNDGHDIAAHAYVQVDLVGPLTNPFLYNLSTDPATWVKFNGSIAAGDTVRLVCSRFSAEKIEASGNLNRVGQVSNYGSRFWVNLAPGPNKLKMTGSGSGHAILSFRPPYI